MEISSFLFNLGPIAYPSSFAFIGPPKTVEEYYQQIGKSADEWRDPTKK